jgi:predicted nucleic acid-binding protein
MVLVDSAVWIDYFNGTASPETDTLDALLGQELVLIGDLILTEVLQGFRDEHDYRLARELLDPLELRVLGGREVALLAADNYRTLRARGITVRKTIDVIIGSYGLLHALPLLHTDRDFDALETHRGLMVKRGARS